MDQLIRQSLWFQACDSLQSHALTFTRRCSQPASDLIGELVRRFCEQPTPTVDDEFDSRNLQQLEVMGRIGRVARADQSARKHPTIAGQIYQLLPDYCNAPLSVNSIHAGIDLDQKIHNLEFNVTR
jgi:hypothetical protein